MKENKKYLTIFLLRLKALLEILKTTHFTSAIFNVLKKPYSNQL
jgi:hypothetical protein